MKSLDLHAYISTTARLQLTVMVGVVASIKIVPDQAFETLARRNQTTGKPLKQPEADTFVEYMPSKRNFGEVPSPQLIVLGHQAEFQATIWQWKSDIRPHYNTPVV